MLKRIIFLAFILVSFAKPATAWAASGFTYDPSNGLTSSLVSLWKMDDTGTALCSDGTLTPGMTDAVDSNGIGAYCGSGGVNINGTATIGKLNNAHHLNGSQAAAFPSCLNSNGWCFNTNWTLAAWVRPAVLGQSATIVFSGGFSTVPGQGGGFGFGLSSSYRPNGLVVKLAAQGGSGGLSDGSGIAHDYDGGFAFDTNWHHIVLTNDGAWTRAYVDGNPTPTAQINVSPANSPRGSIGGQWVCVGICNWSLPGSFNGDVDELAIWQGRVLSGTEVSYLYNSNRGNPYDVLASPTLNNTSINASPVTADGSHQYTISVTATGNTGASWNLGGYNIGTLYGLVNYQGTNAGKYRGYLGWSLQGFPNWGAAYAQGPINCTGGGQGAVFDGYGSQFLNLVSCSTSAPGNTRSASFVVTFKPSFLIPTLANTLSGWAQNWQGYQTVWTTGGTFALSPPLTCSPPSSLVSWWNMNETAGNAVADVWGSNFGSASNTTFTTGAGTNLGNARNFNGSTSVVTIPNSASLASSTLTTEAWVKPTSLVSGAAILNRRVIPNTISSPISYWKLDETSGNVTDSVDGSVGTNYSSTTTSAPSSSLGNARNFNNNSVIVTPAGNESRFDFDYNQPFSIGAWVRTPGAPGTYMTIVAKSMQSSPYSGFTFRINPSNQLEFVLIKSDVGNQYAWATATGTNFANNSWYYVTATYNGNGHSGGITLYVNNNSVATNNFGIDNISTGPIVNNEPLLIGRQNPTPYAYFYGGIDEVGIWNKALSPQEVQTLYFNGVGCQYPFSACTTSTGGYSMELDNASHLKCSFYINGAWQSAVSSGTLGTGSWQHVACAYNGTQISAYLNGNAGTPTGVTGSINNPTGASVLIGKNIASSAVFNGAIDEVRIFSAGLDQTAINAEYQRSAMAGTCSSCGGALTCGVGSQTCSDSYCTSITSSCVVPGNGTGGTFNGTIMNTPIAPATPAVNTVKVCAADTNTGSGSFGTICTGDTGQQVSQAFSYNLVLPGPATYNFSVNSVSVPLPYVVAPAGGATGTTTCGATAGGPTFWYLSDAGVVSGNLLNAGSSNAFSQSGSPVPPGYNLNSYPSLAPTTNASFTYFLSTLLKNARSGNPLTTTELEDPVQHPNCQTSNGVAMTTTNTNIGGTGQSQGFDFYCYSGSNFDSQLNSAVNSASSNIKILYPYQFTQNPANQTISAKTFAGSGSHKVIAFVSGSLQVNGAIAIPSTNPSASAVFILYNPSGSTTIPGDLTINSSVGQAAAATPLVQTSGQLDGLYVFPGLFNDNSDGASNPQNQLVGFGSLISTGNGTWSLARAVDKSTNKPAEAWVYQGKYVTTYNNILSSAKFVWQELPPQ